MVGTENQRVAKFQAAKDRRTEKLDHRAGEINVGIDETA
jgi:hypothetical protein